MYTGSKTETLLVENDGSSYTAFNFWLTEENSGPWTRTLQPAVGLHIVYIIGATIIVQYGISADCYPTCGYIADVTCKIAN